jgi:hypothetical protein
MGHISCVATYNHLSGAFSPSVLNTVVVMGLGVKPWIPHQVRDDGGGRAG